MTALQDDFLTDSTTNILDLDQSPADLRRVNARHLRWSADELRAETINAVAVTGGHLGQAWGDRADSRTALHL
jgi:deoxyxylulose-5-phosphate synthase